MNSYDARVRYTRMVIEDCFLALLQEKPVGRVTVTELCQMAQINRATFYKHYLDIPDLLEKTEEKLLDQISRIYQNTQNIEQVFLELMVYLKNNVQRYMVLGSAHGDSSLMSKTFEMCMRESAFMTNANLPKLDVHHQNLLHHYLSYGIGGVLQNWIQNGLQQTPEDMTKLVFSLCSHVIDGVRQGQILL